MGAWQKALGDDCCASEQGGVWGAAVTDEVIQRFGHEKMEVESQISEEQRLEMKQAMINRRREEDRYRHVMESMLVRVQEELTQLHIRCENGVQNAIPQDDVLQHGGQQIDEGYQAFGDLPLPEPGTIETNEIYQGQWGALQDDDSLPLPPSEYPGFGHDASIRTMASGDDDAIQL
ncbi:hypothetical protein CYMTET_21582 [Cymbomonas tetramitiformis]|uniref:Uncharacterized protein n=1 Tax=Cymbomonas tetramitiformis TaxID=36881 RepID=A0AAE0G233_9CHLO|nr:hypothetical protein CYMTET_21582 [Cymbomonas tetramitiformis]|eukprot:gene6265-7514_t